ncbi:MAG TPA: phosphoenolpyruvate--protein phosphotransferase [Candidatus Tenderia sp.]|nr:phosphoenolpyruvate--protein phosphotransferase [Candidatus Tenderia sp.]
MASLGLSGVGVSRGIAIGRAYLIQRNHCSVREHSLAASDIDAEVERFELAIDTARQQLHSIRDEIPRATPIDIASFIDTHLLMLDDRAIARTPIEIIRQRRCNAEWALKMQRDAVVKVFEAMDDPYLRTRKDDVDHVVCRVQRLLLGQVTDEGETASMKGRIIIADDLSPADTVMMKNDGVAAFITEYGGPTSHTTILARSLAIPAVVGVRNVLRYLEQDEPLIVDGDQGVVIAHPDARGLARYQQKQQAAQRRRRSLALLKEKPATSRDGQPVALRANIELKDDIQATLQVGAKGVGLYRTEFLFMNRTELPGEEEQYAAYVNVVRRLAGAPLTIRTLDLGADKTLSSERREEPRGTMAMNPALGLRAIRLCLRDQALFKTQVRAILRASAEGPVNMMIPMLTTLQEIKQSRALVDEVKTELRRDGLAFDNALPVGGMIEVPAAALSADIFARHLDFLSIGTNDLTQYTLAADRLDNMLDHFYRQIHPAVLRLIDMTINAGQRAGIPVAMCGEMAAEPRYTRLLLGLGLREFSMQPAVVPEIKRVIQRIDVEPLSRAAGEALSQPSSLELEAFVDYLNRQF